MAYLIKAKKAKVELAVIPRAEHSISRSSINEPSQNPVPFAQRRLSGLFGRRRRTRHLVWLKPQRFRRRHQCHPEQVVKVFRNARLIGRRFKLVHVVYGREIIEVATFRAPHSEEHSNKTAATGEQGMILRDNVYGNKDEDAMRRDFTINALYYDISDFSLHAYAGGYEDLQKHQIRLIGDPETATAKILCAHAAGAALCRQAGFQTGKNTGAAIPTLAPLLQQIPAARLFEEVLKLFLYGKALPTLKLLREYRLFAELFPQAERSIATDPIALCMAENTMANTDARINSGKSVTPYFFWRPCFGLHWCASNKC